MAERILHKSPPKEPNKTESKMDSEICLNESLHRSPAITGLINALAELPMMKAASVCYLPGPVVHCVGIHDEIISNLTRLHEDLSALQEMLGKGGAL
jgi:hypothetical protein